MGFNYFFFTQVSSIDRNFKGICIIVYIEHNDISQFIVQ